MLSKIHLISNILAFILTIGLFCESHGFAAQKFSWYNKMTEEDMTKVIEGMTHNESK